MPFDLLPLAHAYTRLLNAAGSAFADFDAALVFVTLASVAGLVALALHPGKGYRSGPVFCAAMFVAGMAVRLPTFLPVLMNPDEATFLSGARRLILHPVFWRSVDGTTSGPLNYYPLAALGVLGFPMNFGTARLLDILCFWAAAVFLYLAARQLMPEWAARLSALPLFAAFLEFRFHEFLQYSSECVSAVMVALIVWLLARRYTAASDQPREWFLLGVAAAALPLAKLQSAPMGATLAAAAIAVAWRRKKGPWQRQAALVIAGGAAVAMALAVYLAAFGAFRDFYESYIINNLVYTGRKELDWVPSIFFSRFVGGQPDLTRYFRWTVVFIAGAAGYAVWKKAWRRPSAAAILGCALTLTALYGIYRPGRPFWHYLLYLVVPVSITLMGALASALSRSGRPKLTGALFVLVTIAAPAIHFAASSSRPNFNFLTTLPAHPTSPAAARISELLKPGELMAASGWEERLFVLTGTVPATRDPHLGWILEKNPQQEYYRTRLLDDIREDSPKVFADAVGPQRSMSDRVHQGNEAVPGLREYVAANYDLIDDIESVRLYLRRGAPLPPAGSPIPVPAAIHAGGGAVTDSSGIRWSEDAHYYGGQPFTVPADASLLKLSPIFLSERFCGDTCEYSLPLREGDYRLRLYFIEAMYDSPGARVFDVTVNHEPVFRDLDILRESGGVNKPLVKETIARPVNGRIVIGLLPKVREAKINGIEILKAD